MAADLNASSTHTPHRGGGLRLWHEPRARRPYDGAHLAGVSPVIGEPYNGGSSPDRSDAAHEWLFGAAVSGYSDIGTRAPVVRCPALPPTYDSVAVVGGESTSGRPFLVAKGRPSRRLRGLVSHGAHLPPWSRCSNGGHTRRVAHSLASRGDLHRSWCFCAPLRLDNVGQGGTEHPVHGGLILDLLRLRGVGRCLRGAAEL